MLFTLVLPIRGRWHLPNEGQNEVNCLISRLRPTASLQGEAYEPERFIHKRKTDGAAAPPVFFADYSGLGNRLAVLKLSEELHDRVDIALDAETVDLTIQ